MCLQISPDLDSSSTMFPATVDLSDACQESNPGRRGAPKSDASKPSVPDAVAKFPQELLFDYKSSEEMMREWLEKLEKLQVAKERADVIVLDDNFATINGASCAVCTDILIFVLFQLTVNIVALFINFVSACITGSAPLTVVQLLWVNMIMDAFAPLVDDGMMKSRPVGRGESFITKVMWRNIIGQSLYPMVNPQHLRKFGLAPEVINRFIHMMEGSHGISAALSMHYITILDSGSAYHCTGDRSQLSDYHDGVAPVPFLRGANGTEMRVHGTGWIYDENFQVKDVLYVPGLNNQPNISKTIFSVSKLNDLGFNILFNADGTVSVMNLEHGIVGKARNFRGLFMLDYLRIPEGRRPGLVKSFWNASLLVWTSITSRLSRRATYAQRPPV